MKLKSYGLRCYHIDIIKITYRLSLFQPITTHVLIFLNKTFVEEDEEDIEDHYGEVDFRFQEFADR